MTHWPPEIYTLRGTNEGGKETPQLLPLLVMRWWFFLPWSFLFSVIHPLVFSGVYTHRVPKTREWKEIMPITPPLPGFFLQRQPISWSSFSCMSVCLSSSFLSVSHSLSHSIFCASVSALLFSILLLIWQSILVHSCVPSLPFLCFGGVLPCRLAWLWIPVCNGSCLLSLNAG